MYKTLGKKFNGVAQATKLFLVGFKDFAKEAGLYFGIRARVLLNSERLKLMTKKELDIYYRWPGEFSKIFPTLAISALPFANYVVIPIAYYYPKHLLSSHFWTSEQKSLFQLEILQRKRTYYQPAFEFLQANSHYITEDVQKEAFQKLLRKVESRIRISPDEILQVQDSFSYKPFGLDGGSATHVKNLCRMHGVRVGLLRRRARLWGTAQMIQYLDFAIKREGTADMKIDELRTACYLRGFDGSTKSGDDMNQFISQWVAVTTTLTPPSYSLILHLPIFLCYDTSDWKPRI